MSKPKPKPKPRSRPSPKLVYQLKITLAGTEPPIWRRVEVLADIRLSLLHGVIQDVMGWEDDHLHQFCIEGECYSDERMAESGETKDESRVKLNKLIQRKNQKFTYEYDFGDSWEHVLVVEEILNSEPDVHYPRCVAGERAAPPEDCGGVWGYAQLLERFADPARRDDEEVLNWLGDDFDPETFDMDGVNKILQFYK